MDNNSLLYNQIEKTDINEDVISEIEKYCNEKQLGPMYIINSPLGNKYTYDYQDNALVILLPKYKIIFIDLKGDTEKFEEYYEDFIEDLNSISDKYEYKQHIGRARDWKENNTKKVNKNEYTSIDDILENNQISGKEKRIGELLISLLIGSINDIGKIGVEIPETILEKIKKNILLFDGEQTRFIYKEFESKTVTIQGLSGTGKTELLLHKLKELYIKDDNSKIYVTCHNKALSNTLRERIPQFFNFMKVEKQIEWNKRLWVTHAWGSVSNPNSGLYSYICNLYNIPFYAYSKKVNYEIMFKNALEHIEKMDKDNFQYAFDYILIDERQDFPDVFFKLCEKITKHKVYIAGDIFQDIFGNVNDKNLEVDIVLNKCYRTDPRTLMFAHAMGLGLFEEKKLNWFTDDYWKSMGYSIDRKNGRIYFSRQPIRRFEDLNNEGLESVIFRNTTNVSDVIKIIKELRENYSDIQPDDIAIIVLDENKPELYKYLDNLISNLNKEFGWLSNRAYENKRKIAGQIYISNPNNVKGLEFPFVLCLTAKVEDTYRYRNILYTMLTRSFIQSYLLVTNDENMKSNLAGLKIINEKHHIETIEPTNEEKEEIEKKIIQVNRERNLSYEDFIKEIFDELKIEPSKIKILSDMLVRLEIGFDKEKTKAFINVNKDFI